ncbi:MAG: IS630 family transposase [Chloroflexi bacterium]|nr:IS630 family transposase [Chloroflexota bacterium]
MHSAYQNDQLRLVRRIHALLAIVEGESVTEVAELLHLGEQTVRDYVCAFIRKGVDSLSYKRPSGRPPKLTKTQRKELADLITAGPEAAGYTSACWSTPVICDLILTRFGVEYHPHYLCELLDELGFSFQKARFVSDHLDEAARQHWLTETWPEIRRVAQEKQAMILFGDEASFAQWGSLSYTWAPKGQQPTVKTSGKRTGYKVFGLIDFFSGRLFWKGQTDRFNAASYMAFLEEVLTQTQQHILLIQDGARYHTSKAMQDFFAAHGDRLTRYQLPSYSPDFNPIEYLWRTVKKDATHLKYFVDFADLQQKVDGTLKQLATLPDRILALMGLYCESLGTAA